MILSGNRTILMFLMAGLTQMNSMAALNLSISNNFFDLSKCSLSCENGGICQYMSGTIVEIQNWMQSGQMIMKCQCTEGYTGMGCEQERPVCNLESLKCPNGVACDTYRDSIPTEYHCDCSVADRVSSTTARFCRNTYTEYCSSGITVEPPISFCTNGGKCKADVISAQIAPFNTSVNEEYEHAGCICPSEYYGPHCEFMRISGTELDPNTHNDDTLTPAPTMEESGTMEPTAADDDDETSLEDMIDKYSSQTTSTNSDESSTSKEEQRQILRIVLSSVFVSVAIIGLAMAAISYRHRRLKRRRLILLQKSLVPKENTINSYCDKIERTPSITGSVSSASAAASFSSVSATNRTIKTGARNKFANESLPTSSSHSRYSNKKKKNSKGNRDRATVPITINDDCDIVSVSNELSFHRRCYPLTPFVVDDDDDDDGQQHSESQSTGGLWNECQDRSSHQIQPLHVSSMMNATPYMAPKSSDHIQSWIVSLSNRAINLTEIVRQPSHYNNHNNLIEPVLDEFNNTCNDIYLVDDDQDEDIDTRNEDTFADHL